MVTGIHWVGGVVPNHNFLVVELKPDHEQNEILDGELKALTDGVISGIIATSLGLQNGSPFSGQEKMEKL